MAWKGAILTDSGGYQVFSLSSLMKLEEQGVVFRSHIDGSKHELTPEKAVEVQETLGSDIMMVLDECPKADADETYARRSMELTTRWAKRCLAHRRSANALFAIVQGGMHPHLRREHAAELSALPFDGMAIGGLSVGESKEQMLEMLAASLSRLPTHRPRYFMGVGRPEDILKSVAMGVDMFDCVLPTRSGRTGLLFTWNGEISVKQAAWRLKDEPPDRECGCPTCRHFSLGYLRHLFVSGEMLAAVLNTTHNLYFYQDLMRRVRGAIAAGRYQEFLEEKLPVISRKIVH